MMCLKRNCILWLLDAPYLRVSKNHQRAYLSASDYYRFLSLVSFKIQVSFGVLSHWNLWFGYEDELNYRGNGVYGQASSRWNLFLVVLSGGKIDLAESTVSALSKNPITFSWCSFRFSASFSYLLFLQWLNKSPPLPIMISFTLPFLKHLRIWPSSHSPRIMSCCHKEHQSVNSQASSHPENLVPRHSEGLMKYAEARCFKLAFRGPTFPSLSFSFLRI